MSVPSGKFSSLPTKIELSPLTSFGSRCGNDDLESIIKATELCNQFGMDVAEMGAVVGFLMECYEKELIGSEDCDGLDLHWGSGDAVVELVKKTVPRDDLGDVRAEGVKCASERIGKGTDKYAFHMKRANVETMDPRVWKTYNLRFRTSSGGDRPSEGTGIGWTRDAGSFYPYRGTDKPSKRTPY